MTRDLRPGVDTPVATVRESRTPKATKTPPMRERTKCDSGWLAFSRAPEATRSTISGMVENSETGRAAGVGLVPDERCAGTCSSLFWASEALSPGRSRVSVMVVLLVAVERQIS